MIFIVVKFDVRPEYSEQWTDLVSEFTESTRREPGNLWFDWSRSVEKPNQFILLEAFCDGEAGVEHVSSDHFKAAMELLPGLPCPVPDIVNVEVTGNEWSKLAEAGGG